MNRTEMIDQLADRFELSRRQAGEVVNEIFHPQNGMLAKALKSGERVSLPGFGTFDVRQRAAGMRRNPQTGESFKAPASKRPVFKAGATLKSMVNGKRGGAAGKAAGKSAGKAAGKAAGKSAGKAAAKGGAKRAR